MFFKPVKKALVGALALVFFFSHTTWSDDFIEEIIVTSQKRAQGLSVQDIPTSVTAFNEDLINSSQAVDLTDIGRMAPNATLHPSATFAATPNFLIRGIGVSGTTRSLDRRS